MIFKVPSNPYHSMMILWFVENEVSVIFLLADKAEEYKYYVYSKLSPYRPHDLVMPHK